MHSQYVFQTSKGSYSILTMCSNLQTETRLKPFSFPLKMEQSAEIYWILSIGSHNCQYEIAYWLRLLQKSQLFKTDPVQCAIWIVVWLFCDFSDIWIPGRMTVLKHKPCLRSLWQTIVCHTLKMHTNIKHKVLRWNSSQMWMCVYDIAPIYNKLNKTNSINGWKLPLPHVYQLWVHQLEFSLSSIIPFAWIYKT